MALENGSTLPSEERFKVTYSFNTKALFMPKDAVDRAKARGWAVSPMVPLASVGPGRVVTRIVRDSYAVEPDRHEIVGVLQHPNDRDALRELHALFSNPLATPEEAHSAERDDQALHAPAEDPGMVKPSDLVGTSEIAARLGVQPKSVDNWRRRDTGFPEPITTVSKTSVWSWPAVEAWATARDEAKNSRQLVAVG